MKKETRKEGEKKEVIRPWKRKGKKTRDEAGKKR